jgi:hypothetical protein
MKIKEIERCIRNGLRRIRQQIRNGDESEIFIWVIPNKLACSQRPLRDHPQFGGRFPLPREARDLVISWVDKVKQFGFQSIIILLEKAQHERYYIRGGLEIHERGLIGYYESKGFKVYHFPLTDYQRPSPEEMQQILEGYDGLPKPVIIHCSAGIDRSTPVAAFIIQNRHKKGM